MIQFNYQNDKSCICELPPGDFMGNVSVLFLGRWKLLLVIIELFRYLNTAEVRAFRSRWVNLKYLVERLGLPPTLLHHEIDQRLFCNVAAKYCNVQKLYSIRLSTKKSVHLATTAKWGHRGKRVRSSSTGLVRKKVAHKVFANFSETD